MRKEIAVAEYEKTVQNAFREVSDALVQQKYLDQQLRIQKQGLSAFQILHGWHNCVMTTVLWDI